ncbi:hypothetical protein GR183_07085 [Stappia sp. GBMRC 2046]|uniref:Isocitrate dehydrogenase/Hypothetical protein TT1725 C-terminal domain-containing protein n=1 Tax=Stappia sediminis TaxID=2692190 RepID=A0A7X3S7F1_9HYPH|nr:hypothetical protein [Stappia sediminis]MXN64664.1 hypothetical protein [Stappia sediminis]
MYDDARRRTSVQEAIHSNRPAILPFEDPRNRIGKSRVETTGRAGNVPGSAPYDDRRIRDVEIVVEWRGSVESLASTLQFVGSYGAYRLVEIVHRGVVIWPNRDARNASVSRFGCRFKAVQPVDEAERRLPDLLSEIGEQMRWVHVEKLGARSNSHHKPLG